MFRFPSLMQVYGLGVDEHLILSISEDNYYRVVKVKNTQTYKLLETISLWLLNIYYFIERSIL